MRIAFDLADTELQFCDVRPGVFESLNGQRGDPRDELEFDFCQRPVREIEAGCLLASSQQPVNDRKDDRRVEVEDQVAVEFVCLQQVEARRVFEAEDEFAVGELVDADQLDFDDGAKHAAESRAELSAEAFVQGLEGPHLLFADAFRAFEIVETELDVGIDAALRLGNGVLHRVRIEGCQQRLDFGLTQDVAHSWGLLSRS